MISRIIYILTGKRPVAREPKPWRPEARWANWKPAIVCNCCANKGDKHPHPNCRICAGTYF